MLNKIQKRTIITAVFSSILIGFLVLFADRQPALQKASAMKPAPMPSSAGKITFTSDRDGQYEIYVMDDDGTNQTRLTNNSVFDSQSSFSSDASKIVFNRAVNGYWEVFTMDADGSNQFQVTNLSGACDPAYSPDGSEIVYRLANEIYITDTAGISHTRLTNNSVLDIEPTYSPDGDYIAFVSERDGRAEIYIMESDGSNPTRLTYTPNNSTSYQPAFSPDGTKIAFASAQDGDYDIYIMDTGGSNVTKLTDNLTHEFNPAFSPDGTKVAYGSYRNGNLEMFAININGTNETQLNNNSTSDDYDPSWIEP